MSRGYQCPAEVALATKGVFPAKPGSRSSNGTKKKKEKLERRWVIGELFKEIRMSASLDGCGGLIACGSSLQHDGFFVFRFI